MGKSASSRGSSQRIVFQQTMENTRFPISVSDTLFCMFAKLLFNMLLGKEVVKAPDFCLNYRLSPYETLPLGKAKPCGRSEQCRLLPHRTLPYPKMIQWRSFENMKPSPQSG